MWPPACCLPWAFRRGISAGLLDAAASLKRETLILIAAISRSPARRQVLRPPDPRPTVTERPGRAAVGPGETEGGAVGGGAETVWAGPLASAGGSPPEDPGPSGSCAHGRGPLTQAPGPWAQKLLHWTGLGDEAP